MTNLPLDPTFLYIISSDVRDPKVYKVGMSRDPKSRLRYLKTASIAALELVKTIHYPSRLHAKTIERRTHGILKGFHLSGEWFSCDLATIISAIETAETANDEKPERPKPTTNFGEWVARMRDERQWSGRECGRRLGCGVNQIYIWSQPESPPPYYIALACEALTHGLPPWTREAQT